MNEQEVLDRLAQLHGCLAESIMAGDMPSTFELADEIKTLAKQQHDDERAAFISTHEGNDR